MTHQAAAQAGSTRGGFTGWHALAILCAFFALMFAVNGVFVYFAVTTFTGVETVDAYRKGLAYNETLSDARRLQGFELSGTLSQADDRLVVEVLHKDGKPVSGLKLDGKVGRPSTDTFDRKVAFEEIKAGRYRTEKLGLPQGNWIVAIEGVDANSRAPRLRIKERLWLSR